MGRKYQGDALYWRRLRNGKYTWKKAEVVPQVTSSGTIRLIVHVEEEE
jgi:hypothetical protein